MERRVGSGRAYRYGDQIDRKTPQPRIEHFMRRYSDHKRGPNPDRENRKLNCSGNADKVPAPGIVGIGQFSSDADESRYGKAAERALEVGIANWSAFHPSNDRAGGDSQYRTDNESSEYLYHEATVPVPQAEADSQYLREERQEKRRDDYSDWVVLDDARREQNRSSRGAGDIAGGNAAQLPEVLDDVRKVLGAAKNGAIIGGCGRSQ